MKIVGQVSLVAKKPYLHLTPPIPFKRIHCSSNMEYIIGLITLYHQCYYYYYKILSTVYRLVKKYLNLKLKYIIYKHSNILTRELRYLFYFSSLEISLILPRRLFDLEVIDNCGLIRKISCLAFFHSSVKKKREISLDIYLQILVTG